MDTASLLPDDPAECRRLRDDLLRSHDALRRQAEDELPAGLDDAAESAELERSRKRIPSTTGKGPEARPCPEMSPGAG